MILWDWGIWLNFENLNFVVFFVICLVVKNKKHRIYTVTYRFFITCRNKTWFTLNCSLFFVFLPRQHCVIEIPFCRKKPNVICNSKDQSKTSERPFSLCPGRPCAMRRWRRRRRGDERMRGFQQNMSIISSVTFNAGADRCVSQIIGVT